MTSLDPIQTLEIIEELENYIADIRPPEEIRDKLDISYRIEDQSIIIFEIRPSFIDPEKKMESPVAKTTYIKSKEHWKIFWLRADLKWHSYTANATVKNLNEFIEVIMEDKHHCFWG